MWQKFKNAIALADRSCSKGSISVALGHSALSLNKYEEAEESYLKIQPMGLRRLVDSVRARTCQDK